MARYTITAEWDEEAGVWYVSKSDIPGLCTEAETVEELTGKVLALAPDLLRLNARHLERQPKKSNGLSAFFDVIAHKELQVACG